MRIQDKKIRLIKIATKCTDLAERHRKQKRKFEDLFEEIYGVEFDGEMDDVVECVDYGNSDLTLEQLEDSIRFQATSYNGTFDENDIKNLDVNLGEQVHE